MAKRRSSSAAVSKAARPRVTAIIVNWHSEDLLRLSLLALDRQTLAPDRVVIVDNGSAGELPLDRYTRGPISVMRMDRNEGFAVANNRAIAAATDAEWIALLNPDAVPEATWLETLVDAAIRHPEAAAFGSKQLMGENHRLVDGLGDVYHVCGAAWRDGHGHVDRGGPLAIRAIFAPCAAAALYRRAALLDVGGFDEDFFCYFEDVDLGFRLRLLGYECMLVPKALVYHTGGATSGGGQSDFAVYHGQRNLVWSYVKNMPAAYFWLFMPQHLLFNAISLVYYVARGQGLVIWRAKWTALRGLRRMFAKRRGIQARLRVAPEQLRTLMASGWLAPYRRGLETIEN